MTVVARLDEFPKVDRSDVGPTIFAQKPWVAESPAIVLRDDDVDGAASNAPEYAYLLEVEAFRLASVSPPRLFGERHQRVRRRGPPDMGPFRRSNRTGPSCGPGRGDGRWPRSTNPA
jgi:hypothetical protein